MSARVQDDGVGRFWRLFCDADGCLEQFDAWPRYTNTAARAAARRGGWGRVRPTLLKAGLDFCPQHAGPAESAPSPRADGG